MWTWVAIDADTKLIPSWLVGDRGLGSAYTFMHDLAERVSNRIQLTTDGHRVYLEAVESAFNLDVDYAMLQKVYGADPDAARRYSPASIRGCSTDIVTGAPNPKHCTSFVERQNLTMRMSPVHAALERVQQEDREPRARCGAPLHALQLQLGFTDLCV